MIRLLAERAARKAAALQMLDAIDNAIDLLDQTFLGGLAASVVRLRVLGSPGPRLAR